MKKITAIVSIFVLTATVFTACRSKSKPLETTRPTMPPVTQETAAPTTQATQPSTAATMPSETTGNGNGSVGETNGHVTPGNGADGTVGEDNNGTTNAVPEGRGITPMPNGR